MSAGRPALVVRGLSKRYDATGTAVRDIDFTVAAGSCTALVGPAGAGKSTLVRILLGLVRPTTGTASVAASAAGPRIGAVLEPRGLHPARSARDHLLAHAAATGVPDVRAEELLGAVGLTEHADRAAGELTPGQLTRAALATALLPGPALLVLDEPTEGLDAGERAWVQELLRRRLRRGVAVVVASRSLAAVVPLADELLVLSEGSVVYEGTPGALRRGHPDRMVVAASTPVALATTLAARGFTDTVMRPDGRLAVAEATEAQIRDAARHSGVRLDAVVPDHVHPDRVLASLTTARTAPGPAAPTPPRYPTPPAAMPRQPAPYGIPR